MKSRDIFEDEDPPGFLEWCWYTYVRPPNGDPKVNTSKSVHQGFDWGIPYDMIGGTDDSPTRITSQSSSQWSQYNHPKLNSPSYLAMNLQFNPYFCCWNPLGIPVIACWIDCWYDGKKPTESDWWEIPPRFVTKRTGSWRRWGNEEVPSLASNVELRWAPNTLW